MVDFAADSVKTGAEFDYTMSGVRAVMGEFSGDINGLIKQADEIGVSYVRGANDAETAFNILRSKALESSKQTRYTAEETAQALHYMGMAGWEYGEALAALDGVMELAAAGNMDVGRTSDIVTDALTAFKKPASEAGHLVDVLAVAASKSNTNVNMLGESFKYAAPLAGALGYSFEDMGLALGLMANAGVKSGRAGRAVNNMLSRLADAPDKVQNKLIKFGISLSDSEGKMLSFRGVMERLREEMGELAGSGVDAEDFADYVGKAFKDNTDIKKLGEDYLPNLTKNLREGEMTALEAFTQLSQDLGDAFTEDMQKDFLNNANVLVRNGYEKVLQVANILGGKQALPALLALINTSEEEFNALAEALDNSAGAGERMQKTMLENLQGDLYKFNSAADVARVAISDKLTPTIREFVQYGTTGITEVTDAFKKGGVEALPDAIEKFMSGAAELIDKHAPEIEAAGTALVKVLSAGIKIAWPYVESVLGFLWDNAKPFIIRIINETSDIVVSTALEAFKTPLQGIADKLRGNVLFGGIADLIDGLYKDGSEKPGSYNMRPESEGLGDLTAKEAADYVYRKYSAGLTEQWQKVDVYAAVDEAFKAGKKSVDEFEQYLQEKGFKVSVDTTEAEQGLKSMEELLTEATQKEYTFKLNIPNIFGGYTGADSQGISDARSMSGGTILRGATMFGWDAQGRPHIGGGEGAEAVVGVNSLDQMIQRSVSSALSVFAKSLGGLLSGGATRQPVQLVLDTGVLVAEIAPEMNNEMSRIDTWRHGGSQ
jgi:TP901 family phage tail tape measure protein